jgi:hypothetical protein
LGSHRCRKKQGIFTRKAKIEKSQNNVGKIGLFKCIRIIAKLFVRLELFIRVKINNKGKEAVKV